MGMSFRSDGIGYETYAMEAEAVNISTNVSNLSQTSIWGNTWWLVYRWYKCKYK